ncbi:hypothetical protein KLEP174_gp46 [Pseudomonas phage vB_PcuM_ KLEP17-4]|nr:hypothetical protein KLEP174_gp46 [Pseudomonas phage vB_PcuM_ KLEP17-4]
MKTIEETRRELFQAACTRLGFSNLSFKCFGESQGCEGCNDYSDERTALYYEFFNAALDAVCIELPQDKPMSNNHEREAARLAHNDAVDNCRAAIESTNLGLKVT